MAFEIRFLDDISNEQSASHLTSVWMGCTPTPGQGGRIAVSLKGNEISHRNFLEDGRYRPVQQCNFIGEINNLLESPSIGFETFTQGNQQTPYGVYAKDNSELIKVTGEVRWNNEPFIKRITSLPGNYNGTTYTIGGIRVIPLYNLFIIIENLITVGGKLVQDFAECHYYPVGYMTPTERKYGKPINPLKFIFSTLCDKMADGCPAAPGAQLMTGWSVRVIEDEDGNMVSTMVNPDLPHVDQSFPSYLPYFTIGSFINGFRDAL